MATKLSIVESAKREAAYRAVDEHFPAVARHIGIGSGSTVVYVVERIAQLPRERTESVPIRALAIQVDRQQGTYPACLASDALPSCLG